jgi:hypothetical protein
MPGKVRRLVTGHNAEGRSIFVSDMELPPGDLPVGGRIRAGMWVTDSTPVSNAGNKDTCPDGVTPTIPPPSLGSVIRVTDFPPDGTVHADPHDMIARGAQIDPERSKIHPGFHRTDTIDYAICLEGEIWALMDEGEKLMKPGDVLIQRGTYHAWSNRSDQNCRMAFILIDAHPVRP